MSAVALVAESPAAHLRNALQILAPWLQDYAARGDDPAALVAVEDIGTDLAFAARRVAIAISILEGTATPACPECSRRRIPSVTVRDGAVCRCIWCGYELREGEL